MEQRVVELGFCRGRNPTVEMRNQDIRILISIKYILDP
jgi:hypothetical protein